MHIKNDINKLISKIKKETSILKKEEAWRYIYPDQCFHLLQCLIVYII